MIAEEVAEADEEDRKRQCIGCPCGDEGHSIEHEWDYNLNYGPQSWATNTQYDPKNLEISQWPGSTNKCIGMFMPNGFEKQIEESVQYDDEGDLICTMEGSGWESLPYPVIIDSGAAASVLPEDHPLSS